MWVFRTLVLVPRPDFAGASPCLALLAAYAAFHQRDVLALGQPLAPLNIAVATALLVLLLRNMWRYRRTVLSPAAFLAWSLGGLLALIILFSPSPDIVQRGYSIYLLASALAILGVVRFVPDRISRIPSIWSGEGPGAGDALVLVAISLALRATGGWILVLCDEPALWILLFSLGNLAADFLTNWIILLYMFLSRLDQRRH